MDSRKRKIAWLIPAHNEMAQTLDYRAATETTPQIGSRWSEVSRTVESLKQSITRDETELRVFVTDDGSTDGCCDGIPGCVRHAEPFGTAISLNEMTACAMDWGADVIGIADAHMRFDPESLEILADKALSEICVVTGTSKGMDTGLLCGRGCDLRRVPQDLIACKWTSPVWVNGWGRILGPMGAVYAMSIETIHALMNPTGLLWDNAAGLWGYQEESLAIKCALLEIPMHVNQYWGATHLYRAANPTPNVGEEKRKNIIWCLSAYFHPDTFNAYFRERTQHWFGPDFVDECLLQNAAVERTWTAGQEIAFIASLAWDKD
jgi:glycosyltransferase involved in cell wall biosynthesis